MPFKPFVLRELGGLNEDESTPAHRSTDLTKANNVARLGKATGTRPGIEREGSGEDYENDLPGTAPPPIQGIYEWRRDQGSTRDMIVVAGTDVYTDDTTTLSTSGSPTITSGQNNVWTFADDKNKLYMAGGAVGDSFCFIDSAAMTVTPIDLQGTSGSITPLYTFAKWGWVFTGGFSESGADENPMAVRYPDYGTDYTDATSGTPAVGNWALGNTLPGLNGYGGEHLTGFGEFQDNNGDWLFALSNRRIYSFQRTGDASAPFAFTDAVRAGCVHQRAFVNMGLDSGDAVWVSEQGIHSLRMEQDFGGRMDRFLSWPIRKTWNTLNRSRLKYTVGGYWQTEGLVVFAFSTGSNTAHDLLLAMDVKDIQELTPETVRFYKWTLASGTDFSSTNCIHFCRSASGTPYLYLGDISGTMARFNRDIYSDLGTAYQAELQTHNEDFDAPGMKKGLGDCYIKMIATGNYSISHSYVFDDGRRGGSERTLSVPASSSLYGTALYGSGIYGASDTVFLKKFYGKGSGETVAHRFSHNTAVQPFWILEIAQDVVVEGEAIEAA